MGNLETLNETEDSIVRQLVTVYLDSTSRKPKIFNSMEEFEKVWKGKNLSRNLDKVLHKYLRANEINILTERGKGKTFQEIADSMKITRSCVQRHYIKITEKLALRSAAIQELFYGAERYEKMREKERKNSIYLKASPLSNRAVNVLTRTFQSDRVNLDEMKEMVKTVDIINLKNCGVKTAVEITEYFKSLGINTVKWEYQIITVSKRPREELFGA